MLPTLAALVQAVTPATALSSILGIANGLGLSTTSWGPFGMVITILETMSEVVAQGSVDVAYIAQGRYLSTACAMTDSNGDPVTEWARLAASEDYGVTFVDAVQAEGMVALCNVLALSRGPYADGALHLKHPTTGATYTSSGVVTIAAASSPTSATYTLVDFVADAAYSGTSGTAVPGTVLGMTTPIPGVSCAALGSNRSSALVGTDAESNAHLFARCMAKLGSIAPNGAAGALKYVATTPSFAALYGTLSAPITRAETALNTDNGTVTVTIANASGGPISGDVAIIQQACQAWAAPTGMTVVVQAAGNQTILVDANIYVTGPAGTLSTDASAAVTEYFANIPIGGTNLYFNGVVPTSGILSAIQSVGTAGQITGINLPSPSANVFMGSTSVPVLSVYSAFVVITVPTP